MINKNTTIIFRVEEEEKMRLVQDAQMAGLPLAELVRSYIAGKKVASKVDYALINELRRQGGLLKSNFATLRSAKASEQTLKKQEVLLKDMKLLIEKISKNISQ